MVNNSWFSIIDFPLSITTFLLANYWLSKIVLFLSSTSTILPSIALSSLDYNDNLIIIFDAFCNIVTNMFDMFYMFNINNLENNLTHHQTILLIMKLYNINICEYFMNYLWCFASLNYFHIQGFIICELFAIFSFTGNNPLSCPINAYFLELIIICMGFWISMPCNQHVIFNMYLRSSMRFIPMLLLILFVIFLLIKPRSMISVLIIKLNICFPIGFLRKHRSSYGFHLALGIRNIGRGPTFDGDHFECLFTKIL